MSEEYRTKEYWEKRTQMYRNDPQSLLFRDPRFEEYEKRTREFLEMYSDPKLSAVDLACGYGRFAQIFLPGNYRGIDFSEEMVKLATEKNPEHFFLRRDLNTYMVPQSFDLVFEVNSLHCLNMTPEQFFEKYKKFAKVAVACLEADRFTIFQIYE